jgi:hypothetical protein
MKTLIAILLLITTSLSAQKPSEPTKVILTYVGAIALNSMGDAFKDGGHKQLGHLCNAVSIGILLTSPFYINYDRSKWYWYLLSYSCIRIGTFDYIYNGTRGLPINYIGGTSTWDKLLQKVKPPETYLGRIIFLTAGITIPINELKHKRQ